MNYGKAGFILQGKNQRIRERGRFNDNMTNKKNTVNRRNNEAIILTANTAGKMLRHLKVPDNLVQVANLNGKLKLVDFWYAVKSFKISGAVCAANFPELSKITELAEKTVYKKLLELHKEGLAMKQGEYFQLCSSLITRCGSI